MFLKYNLDALFAFTHAPGSSAYNPVERRMAQLSKDTTGLILPFDTYGTQMKRLILTWRKRTLLGCFMVLFQGFHLKTR